MRARFSRRTRFALFSVLAFLTLIVLAAGYFFWSRPTRASQSFNLQRTVTEIVADPVRYATNRFTGGIGVALFMDSATGLPKVNGVMPGSPAQAAGLARDDIFLEVNHTSMKGKTLPQAVDMVRGLTVANVDILIQRNGTNLHCGLANVVDRSAKAGKHPRDFAECRGSAPDPAGESSSFSSDDSGIISTAFCPSFGGDQSLNCQKWPSRDPGWKNETTGQFLLSFESFNCAHLSFC